MSDKKTPMFPQDRLDEMKAAARDHNPASLPQTQWRLDGGQFDANESAFVARQLEYMRPGVFAVEYPELKGDRLVPTNTEVDTGAEIYTITITDQVGEVKVSRDLSGVTPMVEVKTSQQSIPVYSMRLGYQYSIQEARAAMFARVALIPRKAMATREQMARKLDDMTFVGDTAAGVKGLLNQSSPTVATIATGSGGSKLWTLKTADEILADLNAVPTAVVTASKEIEIPDTMVLPLSSLEYIGGRRVGDGTTESILSYFKRTTAHIRTVEGTYKAETAGSASATRMTVYKRDPVKIELIVPQVFEQFQPQADGTMVTTICHMRTAGVALYFPGSMQYADAF